MGISAKKLLASTALVALLGLGILPLMPLALAWLAPLEPSWQHLWDHLLLELLGNTFALLLMVGVGAGVMGGVLAYVMSHYRFVGHRWLSWALMLPLAVPAYVMAFVFLTTLDYSGSLQSSLRHWGVPLAWDAREHLWVLALVMSLMFYPYVYGILKPQFERTYPELDIQAAALGAGPWQRLWRLTLPLALPSLMLGMMLVMMETLADFGSVSIFNTPTLTTAIVTAWQDFYSLQLAMQLASLLLIVAWALFTLDQWMKNARPRVLNKWQKLTPKRIQGHQAWWAFAAIFSFWSLAFLWPVSQLIWWFLQSDQSLWQWQNLELMANSLGLAVMSLVVILWTAWMFELLSRTLGGNKLSSMMSLGYALPGNVLAIGILGIVITLEDAFALDSGSLSQSLLALVWVMAVRFFVLGHGPLTNGLRQISPAMIWSARSLGASNLEAHWRISLPLLRPGIVAASGLIMLEVMKELPATYLLRPYDWSALSIRTYELSLEGNYHGAALPALMLITLGLFSLWLSQKPNA